MWYKIRLTRKTCGITSMESFTPKSPSRLWGYDKPKNKNSENILEKRQYNTDLPKMCPINGTS